MEDTRPLILSVTGFGLFILFMIITGLQDSGEKQSGRPYLLGRLIGLLLGVAGFYLFLVGGTLDLGLLPILGAVGLLGYDAYKLFLAIKHRLAASTAQPASPASKQVIGLIDPPRKTFWQRFKIPLIGCGGLLVLLVVAFFIYVAVSWRDSGKLLVEVSAPQSVRVGEKFDVVVRMTSKTDKGLWVEDILLDAAVGSEKAWILSGADVIATEPPLNLDPAAVSMRGFLYNRQLDPGGTHVVTLHCVATKAGEYHTDFFVFLPDSTAQASDIVITITE